MIATFHENLFWMVLSEFYCYDYHPLVLHKHMHMHNTYTYMYNEFSLNHHDWIFISTCIL